MQDIAVKSNVILSNRTSPLWLLLSVIVNHSVNHKTLQQVNTIAKHSSTHVTQHINSWVGGGVSIQTELSLRWSCMAQGPKFKIPFYRSFVPQPIEYACQVSSTSAQRSGSLRVLNMLTLRGQTDGQTHRWTFDWFYKSSQERRLKTKNHRITYIVSA